jgi:uncharacterized protein
MKKIYCDWAQIEQWTQRLAVEILKTDWRPDYVVGLTRGGLTPAVILSHLLDVPMYTLKVSLRDNGLNDSETNCWMSEDVTHGKNILIVDDINDTGATLKWIREDWDSTVFEGNMEHWWHQRVKIAVLVDNLASDERVDFAADEINKEENPSWIVFPWESNKENVKSHSQERA